MAIVNGEAVGAGIRRACFGSKRAVVGQYTLFVCDKVVDRGEEEEEERGCEGTDKTKITHRA